MKFLMACYHCLFPNKTELFWKCRERILHPRGITRLLKPWYLFRSARVLEKLGSSVPIEETIPPFASPHGLCSIFISAGAHLGDGCTIFQQVTIGSNTMKGSKHRGAPTIGNHVYIGAGAKIIGGITVGDNVRIGANCIVTRDIPANSTVVMEAPRVLIRETPPDNTFVGWLQYVSETKNP